MTTVPAALTALVELARSRAVDLQLPGKRPVRVVDGPWLDRPSEEDVIAIGWIPDEGEAVEFTDALAGLGSSQESYDVTCLASSWSGDTDIPARRARVDTLIEAVRAGLKADQTLGGTVTRARLATLSLNQWQLPKGCEVAVAFVVHIDAFRTP